MAEVCMDGNMDGCNDGHGGVKTVGGQGTQTNVLSTQSTSEPDVVNGMRESMLNGCKVNWDDPRWLSVCGNSWHWQAKPTSSSDARDYD